MSEENEPKKLLKVEELTTNSRGVNLIVKVVSKSEVREVISRRDNTRHRVVDALVGDETGSIYLSLWDEKIDDVEVGDTLRVDNGYVSLLRGSMRLNTGRYGSLEAIDESPIVEVNTENNLSKKIYRQERSFSYGRRFTYSSRRGGRRPRRRY